MGTILPLIFVLIDYLVITNVFRPETAYTREVLHALIADIETRMEASRDCTKLT